MSSGNGLGPADGDRAPAAHALLAELGLTRACFQSPTAFRAALPEAWLRITDIGSQAAWVTSLADAMGWERVADRPMGLTAVEGWLGLTAGYCSDPPGFRRALPQWFHELPPTAQARTVSRLADARKHLPTGARTESHNVVEGWLGFGDGRVWPYQSGTAFRDALPGWFHTLPRSAQAQVLEPLARSLLWSPVRGPGCAVAALEGWIGLAREPCQAAHSFRAALPAWFADLCTADQARLVVVLSTALGALESSVAEWLQGPNAALEVLNGWLGLSVGIGHDTDAYLVGLATTAPDLTMAERLSFLGHLANCLTSLPFGDCAKAVTTLEAAIGLQPGWEGVAGSAGALFPEWFQRSDPDLQAWLVATLARGVSRSRVDGRHLAVAVVEGWLGLGPEAYRSPDAFRLALPPTFWHLSVAKQSNLVLTLQAYAADLPGRRRDAGTTALAGWLGLPSRGGGGVAEMPDILPAWFPSIGRDEQASLLSYLTAAREELSGLSTRPARLGLIEDWLGIRPEAYRGAEGFRQSLPDWFWKVGSSHQARLLTSLALLVASDPWRGPTAATAVLESVLGRDPAEITNSPLLRSCEPAAGLDLLTAWVQVADPSSAAFLTGCRAMASYFRHTPLEWFHSAADRSAFIRWSRPHRALLFDRVLRRLWPDAAPDYLDGGPGGWDRPVWGVPVDEPRLTELALMWWGETFENPTLVHRLMEVAATAIRQPEAPPVTPGRWPFAERRGVQSVETGGAAPGPAGTVGAVRCLGTRATRDAGLQRPRGHAPADCARAETLENAFRSLRGLGEVLPEYPAVWLRTHFDSQGALYWWAVRRDAAGPHIVARGRSSPGAESALRLAVVRHDLCVERAWAEYGGVAEAPASGTDSTSSQGDPATAMQQFGPHLRHPRLIEALRRPGSETREQFARAFQSVREHRPRLAAFGLDVLASLGSRGLGDRELDECAAVWESAVGGAAAPPGATRLGRLDAALQAAFARLVGALARCIDLSPWWATAPDPAEWSRVDVLIQPHGALWAVPLGWLDLGGQPLFRRVASAGCVASLSLRALAARRPAGGTGGAHRVLAAHWLDADSWSAGLTGPVGLHAELGQLAERHGWQLVGLGDDPAATATNLIAQIAAHAPRVVVVCGHGDEDQAAVLLGDGPWRGAGADLDAVDLLVLASCSVGRLRQDGRHDVEGLFVEMAAHRGRCVVAARWPVADTGAAACGAEVVRCYLSQADAHRGTLPPFARARAFNEARTRLLTEARVPEHLVAAFDVYNYG